MWCVHEILILFRIGFSVFTGGPSHRWSISSKLEWGHLQQTLHQIGNAVVFCWLCVITEQLTTHHLSAEMRQLDAWRAAGVSVTPSPRVHNFAGVET